MWECDTELSGLIEKTDEDIEEENENLNENIGEEVNGKKPKDDENEDDEDMESIKKIGVNYRKKAK